ncbi:MAG TPA: branched-chain amino acid ABC transporter permease [Candidatus Dormibacteraeota bacterium]|nr:branched-chain amino acid ABC transporter permease [Candidatus Dormibacteraeota bacterium]
MGQLLASSADGIVVAAILAVAAMGFTLQFGLTNVINLSFGAVMTIGGFTAYLANVAHLNAWLGMLLGGVAGAVATVALGRGVLRLYARRRTQLFEMMMVTLGMGLVIDYGLQAISQNAIYGYTVLRGAPLRMGPIAVTPIEVGIIVMALVILVAAEAALKFTKLGKALRATAVEPSLARSCGIQTGRVVLITWTVSGFLCGIAGVVYIISTQSVDYSTGELFLPLVIAAAILGGVGSIRGAVVASLVMGLVTEIVAGYGGAAYSTVAGFAILVVVLLVRPGSVSGGAEDRQLVL